MQYRIKFQNIFKNFLIKPRNCSKDKKLTESIFLILQPKPFCPNLWLIYPFVWGRSKCAIFQVSVGLFGFFKKTVLKKKVISYLLGQNLTDEQRLLILLLQGYTIQDREYKNYTKEQVKNKLLKYILAMKITQSEKADLLSKIGYEVKNGRVIINR